MKNYIITGIVVAFAVLLIFKIIESIFFLLIWAVIIGAALGGSYYFYRKIFKKNSGE